jgi:SAM-dependent methyltransferase
LNNSQTFSQGSDQYARHRPQYPEELFAWLNDICAGHDSAWDCATGSGQAAVSLARYFSRVEATDISAEQIEHGIIHPRVRYSVSPAEHTPFADSSFDLITVATAVHWFEQEPFHWEVERVLKPEGILAVWTYGLFEIEPEIDGLIARKFMNPIDRFWAEGNRRVMNGYRDLTLPFEEMRTPGFSMQVEWTLGGLSAYLRTWSAVKRYSAEVGADPVEGLERSLKTIWGEPDLTKMVRMPLFVRACRKSAAT